MTAGHDASLVVVKHSWRCLLPELLVDQINKHFKRSNGIMHIINVKNECASESRACDHPEVEISRQMQKRS